MRVHMRQCPKFGEARHVREIGLHESRIQVIFSSPKNVETACDKSILGKRERKI